jgi:NADH dehydrogenase
MQRIVVTGGTGFVGRAVCEQLSRRWPGVAIVVPTRRLRFGCDLQTIPGVQIVPADIHDGQQLARVLAGADAVVHLVAILHGSAAQFERAHVELPRQLAAACQAAAVRRLVHVSALGVDTQAPSNYLRSKAAGEEALRRAGLDLSVLRPSVIFGARDRFLNVFAQLQVAAPVVPLAGADARFQPVWVDDVARAVVQCLDDPTTIGQTYECAGPDVVTLADLVRLAGRLSGHERPIVPLPEWAGRMQARVMEMLPGEPLMSTDNVDSMRVPNIASGMLPGLRELGIEPAALAAVAPGYLAPGQGVARLDRWRAQR